MIDLLSCEWDTAKFLIISENVFDPLIYYSHLSPVIICFLFGLLIFFRNRKSPINQSLFSLNILLSAWLFSDLVLWAEHKPEYIMFFWTIVNTLEPIIYATALYFLICFILQEVRPVSNRTKLAVFAPILPVILLGPTIIGITGFNYGNCDREVFEGSLVFYNYIIEGIYLIAIAITGLTALRKTTNSALKKQIIIITFGLVLSLITFSSGNIIGTISEDWALGQYGLLGIPLFIGFIVYSIVKFRTFNIKLVGAQALVIALWFLLFAILFIKDIPTIRTVIVATLIFIGILGVMLIRSVKREVKSRELIEEQKALLEKANIRLKALDKQKTEFVSLASHQLRAPMTAIKGFTTLILDGDYGKVPEELRQPLQHIFTSTQSLIQIVGDFLDVTRIELGTMKFTYSDFDLKQLITEITQELKPNIEISKLQFDLEVPDESFPLHGDAAKLKQVFNNLIDNALKYTKEGCVRVILEKDSGIYRFKVVDSGVGINPETLPKLFDKFVRAENANDANVIGTGLGLFVAKQMIQKHNGKIWAESEGVGKGSTFIVELKKDN